MRQTLKKIFGFVVIATAMQAQAGTVKLKYTGLLCEDRKEYTIKYVLEVGQGGNKAKKTVALLFRGYYDFMGKQIAVVPLKEIKPLLEGNLKEMVGKTFEDKEKGTSVTFKEGGRDFTGAIRLSIEVRTPQGSTYGESCNPRNEPQAITQSGVSEM